MTYPHSEKVKEYSKFYLYFMSLCKMPFFALFLKKRTCPDGYFKTTTTETGYQFNLLMSGTAQEPYNLGTI